MVLNAYILLLAGSALSAASATPNADRPTPSNIQSSSSTDAGVPDELKRAELVLLAGTEVKLRNKREVSTRYNRLGDRFELLVAEDVLVDDLIVIPRGATAIGEITRLERNGPFGKSGKLEVRMLFVTVGDHRVRLEGIASRHGRGGTGESIAAGLAGGPLLAAVVKGTSGIIPADAELSGYVEENIVISRAGSPVPATPLPIGRPPGPAPTAADTEAAPDGGGLN